jgi:hypothetical protein
MSDLFEIYHDIHDNLAVLVRKMFVYVNQFNNKEDL